MARINPYLKGRNVPKISYQTLSGKTRSLAPHRGRPLQIIIHEGHGDFDVVALDAILRLVNDRKIPTREILFPKLNDSRVTKRVKAEARYEPLRVTVPKDESGREMAFGTKSLEQEGYRRKIFDVGEIQNDVGNLIFTGGVFEHCLRLAFETLLGSASTLLPFDAHFPLDAIYANHHAVGDASWNPDSSSVKRLWEHAPIKTPIPHFTALVRAGKATHLSGSGDPAKGCLRIFYWKYVGEMIDFIKPEEK
jgi:hypothetical protein